MFGERMPVIAVAKYRNRINREIEIGNRRVTKGDLFSEQQSNVKQGVAHRKFNLGTLILLMGFQVNALARVRAETMLPLRLAGRAVELSAALFARKDRISTFPKRAVVATSRSIRASARAEFALALFEAMGLYAEHLAAMLAGDVGTCAPLCDCAGGLRNG